jgi:predicted  nucleic acid-binding Zn-ribbon protein
MSEDLTKNLPPEGVGIILTRLDSVDTRLTSLEERVDRRLSETRPIWEQVLARMDVFDEKLGAFDEKLGAFDEKLGAFDEKLGVQDQKIENLGLDMRAGFKRLDRHMAQLHSDVVTVRSDQNDLERRMDRLEDRFEPKPTP